MAPKLRLGSASNSFTKAEVTAFNRLYLQLLQLPDVRVQMRQPELVNVARKFQAMADVMHRKDIAQKNGECVSPILDDEHAQQ